MRMYRLWKYFIIVKGVCVYVEKSNGTERAELSRRGDSKPNRYPPWRAPPLYATLGANYAEFCYMYFTLYFLQHAASLTN